MNLPEAHDTARNGAARPRPPRRQKDPARDAALTRRFHAVLSDPRRWPKSWHIIRVDTRMLR